MFLNLGSLVFFVFVRAEAVELCGSLFYCWKLPCWCQSLEAVSVFKPSLSSWEHQQRWFRLVPDPKPSSETGLSGERDQKQDPETPHSPEMELPQVIRIRHVSAVRCVWIRLWNLPLLRGIRQEEAQEEQEPFRFRLLGLWQSRTIQRRWDNPEMHSLRDNHDPAVEGRATWTQNTLQCLRCTLQIGPSASWIPSSLEPDLHPNRAFQLSQEDHRDEKERWRRSGWNRDDPWRWISSIERLV